MDFINILTYLSEKNSKDSEFVDLYKSIVSFNKIHFIPYVSYEIALFLRLMANLKQPKNILEIGFGSGVSSIFIKSGIKKTNKFITLELDKNRYNRGIELLKKFNISNIELIYIDAFEYFKKSKIKFDYIFLDAVKRDYHKYIEPIKMILNKGGVFLTDNVLFGGRIVKESVEKKYENGVKFLKKFNEDLSNDKSFETLFLPIGDGISISIKL